MQAPSSRRARLRIDLATCALVVVTVLGVFHLDDLVGGSLAGRLVSIVEGIENRTYDYRVWLRTQLAPPPVTDRIVQLVIDNDSLATYGRWPWPRRMYADIVEELVSLGARAVFFDIELPEPAEKTVSRGLGTVSIEEAIAGATAEIAAALDPKQNARTFEPIVRRGTMGLPETVGFLRELLLPHVDQIGQIYRSSVLEPDALLASTIRAVSAPARDTAPAGVFGVFFFEDARTLAMARQAGLAERAFRAAIENPEATLGDERLAVGLGRGALADAVVLGRLHRFLNGRFDAPDLEALRAVSAPPEAGTAAVKEAQARLLEDGLARELDRTPPASDEVVIERCLGSLGASVALNKRRAQTMIGPIRAARHVVRLHGFDLDGGGALRLPDPPRLTAPVPLLASAFTGLGTSTMLHDVDGVIRRVPLLWRHRGRVFGQAMLPVALHTLEVSPQAMKVVAGPRLVLPRARLESGLADLVVPLDASGQLIVQWASSYDASRIRRVSISELLTLVGDTLDRFEFLADPYRTRSFNVRVLSRCLATARRLAASDPDRPVARAEITGEPAGGSSAEKKPARQWERDLRDERDAEVRQFFQELRRKKKALERAVSRLNDPVKLAEPRRLLREVAGELEMYEEAPARRRARLRSAFAGKVVLVGASATAAGDFAPTPLSEKDPNVALHANVLNQLLTGRFIGRADPHTTGVFALIACGLAVAVFVGHVGFIPGAVLAVALMLAYAALAAALLVVRGYWIDVCAPELVILLGSLAIGARKYVHEERSKQQIRHMFESYVDPKYVDEIINDPTHWAELGGVERPITAFFSDLEGVTTLSELLTAEEVSRLLTA
ncbi:MAG: CHASE2 domain-containing protein, partial [Candidatus Riflebacteria bacterium]|nr:CHASE2 domain-containing protein [Candidatus Riflebacteria bacterium]